MKELSSLAALILTFIIFVPYIRSIRAGRTRPHVFSWLIWGLGTFVVFLAQLAGGAGAGAWPIGISGLITFYVAWLAWRRRADTDVTRSDWAFLFAALAAIPAWALTSDPLWAVLILTTVDLAGFGPTFRAAWTNPHAERAGFYALAALRNLLVVLALERYSTTTALFPAAVGVVSLALAVMILSRRALPPA